MPTKRPRVNLSIPPEIYAELQAAARVQGMGLSSLVMQAIGYARPTWRRVAARGGNTVSAVSSSRPVKVDLGSLAPADRLRELKRRERKLTPQQQKFRDKKKKSGA